MLLRTIVAALALVLLAPCSHAHSGKARFHIIVDTDGAADDLRTLCMLLGNREIEVLAVTASEGALAPDEAARRVAALLDGFYHEGIPVGEGRGVGAPAPAWRAHSQQVDWGPASARGDFPAAQALIAETIETEEEKIVFVALGALTNLSDVLEGHPELAGRIAQVVWYNEAAEPSAGANALTDPEAVRRVLASGVPVTVVAASKACPVRVSVALLDSVAAVATPYARKIVQTHRTPPLAQLADAEHLAAWDDLAAVYLFAPELFTARQVGEHVRLCTLRERAAAVDAAAAIVAILRGKPDSECRVFYGFPVSRELYAAEVVPIVDRAIDRHGASEWRAGVLTNELHGHLGIYATVGVKMGIRAREYFNIGVDDIVVTTYAGHKPPVSCMNDGLQVSTGATVGHGLITVAEEKPVRPEAQFSFKGKTIRLKLKAEYADRIRRDVQRGVELYGDLTELYWKYIRELALQYWLDFDRHEMFELYIAQEDATA